MWSGADTVSWWVSDMESSLVGVGLESKTLRKWLGASVVSKAVEINDSHSPVEIQEPQSYTGSFNPFPALVIGITGAAMSAHHQTYVFQVCPSVASRNGNLISHIGPNPRTMGLLALWLCYFALYDIFLHVVATAQVDPSISPANRGPGQLLPSGGRARVYHE